MKYRLKNKKLEQNLNKSFKNFKENLQDCCKNQMKDETPYICIASKDDPNIHSILFNKEAIEAYEEYNPTAWNNFPQVTPPEDVWMRLEVIRYEMSEQHTHRMVVKFNKGKWKFSHEGLLYLEDRDIVRFRPWNYD